MLLHHCYLLSLNKYICKFRRNLRKNIHPSRQNVSFSVSQLREKGLRSLICEVHLRKYTQFGFYTCEMTQNDPRCFNDKTPRWPKFLV